MNKYLEHLIKDPLVYYVYQSDLSIYGIPTEEEKYIVIVNKDYQVPKDFEEYKTPGYDWKPIKFGIKCDNVEFTFFEMQEWFSKVLNCEVLAWQCSCLDKKFIKKEHVKLTLEVDPLKLRKNFTAMFDPYFLVATSKFSQGDFIGGKLKLFEILKEAEFSNQIIDNHKIVNFKTVKEYYDQLTSVEDNEDLILKKFLELQDKTGGLLIKRTEVLYRNSKTKKIIQNE